MSLRHILIHPDPRLKKKCAYVTEHSATIERLCDDLLVTMYEAPGVGLAAPQVGVISRIFVMDCSNKEDAPEPHVLINPEITWVSDELNTYNEGCLSIPEQFEDVTRPAEVRVKYSEPKGAEVEKHFTGIWATCAQHEIDHLNGRLFIDHLSALKRRLITDRMKKLKRERARAM
jgi:peptide deformylase